MQLSRMRRGLALAVTVASLCVGAQSANADVVDDKPGAGAGGPGQVTVAARAANGETMTKSWSTANWGWTPWRSLGGFASSGPAVAVRPDNTVDYFVRGGDNALYHRWREPNGAEHDWEWLGGGLLAAPAAVVRKGTNALDVVVRAGGGNIMWKEWTNSTGWSGYADLGGWSQDAPAIVSTVNGGVDVFIRGSDNQIYAKSLRNNDWNSWSGWAAIGGGACSAPTAASAADGAVDVFYTGCDGNIWQRSWGSGGWSQWIRHDAAATSAPAAFADGKAVTLVVRGGSRMYYNQWNGVNSWSGFQDFGSPDEPGVPAPPSPNNPNPPAPASSSGDLSDLHGDSPTDSDETFTLTQDDLNETDPAFTTCAADPDLDSTSYCSTAGEGSTSAAATPRAAGPSPALSPGGLGWGLADQKAEALLRPETLALSGSKTGRKVRLIVPWDVMRLAQAQGDTTYTCTQGTAATGDDENVTVTKDSETLAALDAWVAAARSRYAEITLTFGHSRNKAAYCYLPTPATYKRWVGAVLDRYSDIKNFTTWNEPNDAGQPTSFAKNKATGPRRAAQYYKALRSACVDRARACNVASADFLDNEETLLARTTDDGSRAACRASNAPSDCKSYLARYLQYLDGAKPKFWAFHAYDTGTRRTTQVLRTFIRRTTASAGRSGSEYWMTEQGGRADYKPKGAPAGTKPRGTIKADGDLQYLLTEVPKVDSRITRFYLYHLWGDGSWDSGLLDWRTKSETNAAFPRLAPRRMFCTYAAVTVPGTACTFNAATDD